MRQGRNRASGGSSSQTPHPSPRRRRQVSSVPLLVLSKLQTLRWFAIWFLYCALTRAILWPLRGLNALFGRRIAIFPTAYSSDECTTHSCGQTVSTSVLLISGILGRLRFCTIGVYVDGLPFPRQRVLPSHCVATILDESVVTKQAAL